MLYFLLEIFSKPLYSKIFSTVIYASNFFTASFIVLPSDAAAINTLQDDKPQELLFSEGEQYTFTQMQNLIGTLALSEDGSWGINSSGGASFIGQTESTINTYGLIIGGVAVVIGSIALLYFKKYHKKCPRHKTGQHN